MTIYIDSDLKVRGTDKKPPQFDQSRCIDIPEQNDAIRDHERAMQFWKDSTVEFEDQGRAYSEIWSATNGAPKPEAESILEVELPESEVVEQYRYVNAPECGWFEILQLVGSEEPKEYRRVLRFVNKVGG